MKKLLTYLFFLTAINTALAQANATQKQFVTLGGIESGSNVSIMQVLDYPVLILADKNEKIKSFEITILHDANQSHTTSYKVEGERFNQNVLDELKAAMGKKGKIFIENILVLHDKATVQEKNMVFHFEQ